MAVNHDIKVFARLKKEHDSSTTANYTISRRNDSNDFEDLIFRSTTHRIHGCKSFRFHKIFGEGSSQDEIFETVAKPLIKSALEGYNCTIFAYGQTGSGKTYTITGSPNKYADRGIIPRSIQYIFKRSEKMSPKPLVHISYMEIYNEIGYDLLHPRQINAANSLDELP
ncbi:unnamed protein product [Acanthoscelides obtectus]|nr:unnamed protein product [Acanthoscelides obtectus]CAK1673083.1 Kinesin-like protein KIF6 [Acanthoscelides obtectus]